MWLIDPSLVLVGGHLHLQGWDEPELQIPVYHNILIENGHLLDNIPVGGVEFIKTGLPLLVPILELSWSWGRRLNGSRWCTART